MADLNSIKNWFKTGLKPTQVQFWETLNSFRHKQDPIDISEIENATTVIDTQISTHNNDANAHSGLNTRIGALESYRIDVDGAFAQNNSRLDGLEIYKGQSIDAFTNQLGRIEILENWKANIQPSITQMLARLTTIETKLATIASGAQVNVQADFDMTNGSDPSFIKNKPLYKTLYVGSAFIGDPNGSDTIRTINIPNVGWSYIVTGSIRLNSGNWDADNDVMWTVRNKNPTSFELVIREVANQVQSLTFEYAIISQY